ncbi:MAG: hypothetical protein AAGF06_05045 [Pseudomonadota bacterium]
MTTLSPLRCLSLLTPLLFAGCIKSVAMHPVSNNLPDLYNVKIQSSTVQFYAMSNGCSTNEHFEAQVVEDAPSSRWQVIRVKRDLCRRSPMKALFDIPLPSTSLTTDKLLNKTIIVPTSK